MLWSLSKTNKRGKKKKKEFPAVLKSQGNGTGQPSSFLTFMLIELAYSKTKHFSRIFSVEYFKSREKCLNALMKENATD